MTPYKNIYTIIPLLLIYLFILPGCDQSEMEEETQDEHVCEHLTAGPEIGIDALADLQSALDSLALDPNFRIQAQLHTRYDIQLLPDAAEGFSGYVPYKPVADEGDYILYMNQSVNFLLLNATDNSTVLPETVFDHSDYCNDVAYKGIFHLDSAITYALSFENSSEAIIGVLFPKASDDDHDH